MKKKELLEQLDEKLCDYCPLDDNQKGSHLHPFGYSSCEGCSCEDALEQYIEENEIEIED